MDLEPRLAARRATSDSDMTDMTDVTPEWCWPPTATEVVVYPSDNEPEPAIYGPNGEVLRWRQRPIGYRRLTEDEDYD